MLHRPLARVQHGGSSAAVCGPAPTAGKLGRGTMRYVLTLANVPNLALGFTFVEAAKRAAASRRKRSHGGSAEVPSVPS